MAHEAGAMRTALDDSLAVAREFDGAPIGEKLAALGLEEDDVREVLRERWEVHSQEDCERAVLFARAYTEGLLTGMRLR